MHEMSLMGEVLNIIQKDAMNRDIKSLDRIDLIVGEISNVMPDALLMAFEIYKEQNPHFINKQAILMIQLEEAHAECFLCGEIYKPEQRIALCPNCKTPSGRVTSGENFQVLTYEGS